MDRVFELDHAKLKGDPRFAAIGSALSAFGAIDSAAAFNRYCHEACRLWREYFWGGRGATSAQFARLLERIEAAGEETIRTAWGGGVVVLHEHPRVEKWLVIREGGFLALEMHEEKDEHLEVKEGAGLILWRRIADQPLAVQALEPGDEFHLEPGKEIVSLELTTCSCSNVP